jgi:hypothetical protein
VITEFLLSAGAGFAGWILQLLPSVPDGALIDAEGNVAGLASLVSSMSVWVNWAGLAAQITFVLGLYFTFLAIRIVRAIIGHVPFIGGNG